MSEQHASPFRRSHRAAIALAMVLVATVSSSSCTDTPEPTAVPRMRAPDSASRVVAPEDPGLNYNDTWTSAVQTVAETTIVSSSEPFFDPVTNENTTTLVLAEPPQQVPVLAGYGFDGQLRVTTNYETTHPLATATVRQIGDATSDVNASGATFASLPQEPAWELGTLRDAQIDVSASTGAGTSCETTSVICNGAPVASRVGGGHSRGHE